MHRPRAVGRRPISGLLLLDKPSGMTSNVALQTVKRLYRATKAGHTGSLDPLAEGMLPICLGEATKLSGFLLEADKTYRFRCRLGVITATGDAEGEVLERNSVHLPEHSAVEAVLRRFTGTVEQLPPMHSSLKHQGQRLYNLARQGIEVERRPRWITIYELRLLGMGDATLDCEARCSKGTYIRTLAEDIGRALGCGAHVEALRRTAVSPFTENQMIPLARLKSLEPGAQDALLLSPDRAIADWPGVRVDALCAHYLGTGQPVQVPQAPAQGHVRLYGPDERFLGVGEILGDGRVAMRRLIRTSSDL
ncbi:MAG: tRNA pseudouridine(55) synthase TruB [Candidatus Competibacterales bacterium]|nr:tRNA pseudouridine(55) synthase TruB [Candidatus Competibacterales bacterium]